MNNNKGKTVLFVSSVLFEKINVVKFATNDLYDKMSETEDDLETNFLVNSRERYICDFVQTKL